MKNGKTVDSDGFTPNIWELFWWGNFGKLFHKFEK